jgi:hypothetical protein
MGKLVAMTKVYLAAISRSAFQTAQIEQQGFDWLSFFL